MNLMKTKIILTIIVIIAAFLRFWQLGANPPSLTWDEAAWGYNAYSLGIDGRDEFGRFLPFDYLESFGDFKPPVYAYLDVIPIKLFGLNEFATRFPSALFGVLNVLMTYFLVKRVFYNSVNKEKYALFSSLFLSISPWHIMLSRAAFEANIASFFIVMGIWLFLGGIQEKKWYIIFSAISFALSIYTFNSARIVAPLVVLLLTCLFRRRLMFIKRQVVLAFIIGCILILPTLSFLFSPQASLRFKEVNIFSDSNIVAISNQEITNDNFAWWSRIIHNRRLGYGMEFLRHYFDNLNPIFLFIKGDGNPKFSIQDVGQMYWWDIIFLVGGAIFLFKRKEGYWFIVPLWLILAIIPAAIARETPHALRTENALPTLQIFTAYGFVSLMNKIKKFKSSITLILLTGLFINFLYFYHNYFVHYARIFSGEWQYGYKDSIAYVKKVGNKYDQIYITDDLGRPYIYYLFYTKTDPRFFRKSATVQREALGFVTVSGFLKYSFLRDMTYVRSKDKKILYVDRPLDAGSHKILQTFYLLNGNKTLVAYE